MSDPYPLEESMARAMEGSREGARLFFELLLEANLTVLHRHQEPPVKECPGYPNDLLDVLGVESDERVVVPAFSRPELIQEWSERPFLYRSIKTANLLEILPDSWWLCLNPGAAVEKELSPWEIEQLRKGNDAIESIIEELFPDELPGALEISSPPDTEYMELKQRLTEEAKGIRGVRKLFLLSERIDNAAEETKSTLLLGVLLGSSYTGEIDQISSQLKSVADLTLIGASPVRIYAGTSEQSVNLSIFKGTQPFFSSVTTPWLRRLGHTLKLAR